MAVVQSPSRSYVPAQDSVVEPEFKTNIRKMDDNGSPESLSGSSTDVFTVDGESQVASRAQMMELTMEMMKNRIVPLVQTADLDASYLAAGSGLMLPVSTPAKPVYSTSCLPGQKVMNGTPTGRLRPAIVDPVVLNGLDDSDDRYEYPTRIPDIGLGLEGLEEEVRSIMASSVNTFSQGFLDKLYGGSNPPSMAADMLLNALNTNLHVRHVSPALSDIERQVSAELASMLGWKGPDYRFAGGVSQPGGSASNQLAVMVARATMFPDTRIQGNDGVPGRKKLIIFTSAHSHYSIEKAAMVAGLGLGSVRKVPVDRETGEMNVALLKRMIEQSNETGTELPFFVNATAGTTVFGSYDPILRIAEVTKEHNIWLHVDGSWGGSVIFSPFLAASRMHGIEQADSFSICPHKMLGVAVICSFLIVPDVRKLKEANTLAADYLFHDDSTGMNLSDLADLTPQCGRRGDALKLYLSLTYYGTHGYRQLVDGAFENTQYMAEWMHARPDLFSLVLQPRVGFLMARSCLPCLQVCFSWVGPVGGQPQTSEMLQSRSIRTRLTAAISHGLIPRGYMVDYAPLIEVYAEDSDDARLERAELDKLMFLRVVINRDTSRATVNGLIQAISAVAAELDMSRL